MTPEEFTALLAQRQQQEKTAGRLANLIASGIATAAKAKPAAKQVAQKAFETATPAAAKAVSRAQAQGAGLLETAGRAANSQARSWAQGAKRVGGQVLADPVGSAKALGDRALSGVSAVGENVLSGARKGVNYLDDEIRTGRGLPTATRPMGSKHVGRLQAAGERMTPVLGQNPLNLAVGGTTLAGGAYGASHLFGGGSKEHPAAAPMAYAPQPQQPQGGGGLMDMWNSLPIEARYAIGAGVPLALAGAYMHGSGNNMGAPLGLAGLGAAGYGAARAGMFGQGAQQFTQNGGDALMSLLRGHGMGGADPNYHQYLHGQLTNHLANNSVKSSAAYGFGEKVARCWAGYEPVPGKKPYSNDSCRPVGSKKSQKATKEKSAASSCSYGHTSMTATPSSRGTSKAVTDLQKGSDRMQPTDATNHLQTYDKSAEAFLWAAQLRVNLEKEAFFGTIARGIGSGLNAAGNYIQGLGSSAQKGLNNFADAADQRGKQMYYTGARMYNKAVQPFRAAGAAAQGFGSGLVQGAQNIASLPGQAANAVVNAGSQAANAVGGAIQNTGTAIGDAVGSTYGAGRNAVVNTARDVRQGVNQAVDTARSYVPSVRNPFHYESPPGQPVGPQYAGPQL